MRSTASTRSFEARPTRSARTDALEIIRQKIVRLELLPGSRISENKLAVELGISRTPVRESIIVLAQERLVFVVPQVGTIVAPINELDIATAQFVRESLELAALQESAGRVTPEQLTALRDLVGRQREAARVNDAETFFSLDEEFHYSLMSISGHGSAWRTVGQAKAHLDRARRLTLALTSQVGPLIDQHQEVIDCLGEGRTAEASAALRGHLRRVFEDIASARTHNPEFFSDTSPVR